MTDLLTFMGQAKQRVDRLLQASIPLSNHGIHQAMAYSVLSGGKRLRPIILYATADSLSLPLEAVDDVACAVELIHCYSLIHDDLPAMDDDDLRRGKPTCHIAFNEATAILAGDALQTLAFEQMSKANHHINAEQQLKMIQQLSQAIGMRGMAYGQALDIVAHRRITLDELKEIHWHKTGIFIKACIQLSLIAAKQSDHDCYQKLSEYGDHIGLAFQIQDDILDIEGEANQLGKLPGMDVARNKATYPAVIGMAAAKRQRDELYQQAIEALRAIDMEKTYLAELAALIVQRQQ